MDPRSTPAPIQNHVDALLAAYDGTSRLVEHPAFALLTSWCEGEGQETTLDQWEEVGSVETVFLEAERSNFCDEELRDREELPGDQQIQDAERLAFMLSHVTQLFEGQIDADLHPACSGVPIESRSGRRAMLCYGIRGYSFTGIAVDWFGVFEDMADFRAWLRKAGYLLTLADLDQLTAEEKLAYWSRA